MRIDYGPPGAMGVKQLAYVSGDGMRDDADYVSLGLHRIAKPVGAIAAGAWGFAWITGRPVLRRGALGVALAAVLVQWLTKPT